MQSSERASPTVAETVYGVCSFMAGVVVDRSRYLGSTPTPEQIASAMEDGLRDYVGQLPDTADTRRALKLALPGSGHSPIDRTPLDRLLAQLPETPTNRAMGESLAAETSPAQRITSQETRTVPGAGTGCTL